MLSRHVRARGAIPLPNNRIDGRRPRAAKDWLRNHTVGFAFIEDSYKGELHRVRYQHPGERQKWRYAWCDPAVVPDPRGWLEARLGPLAGFEITIIRFTLKANDFTVGRPDFATPPLTVRPGPGQEPTPGPPVMTITLDISASRIAVT
jgi:hypothetical protein